MDRGARAAARRAGDGKRTTRLFSRHLGGDLLSRPRLTGSWGGLRDEMGKKGIVLDLDFILTPQAVATGGINTVLHVRRLGRRREPDQVLVQRWPRRQRRDSEPTARHLRDRLGKNRVSGNFLPFLRQRL